MSITITDSNNHVATCTPYCAVKHCRYCVKPAIQGLPDCGHHAFTTERERTERGSLGPAVAVLGCTLAMLLTMAFFTIVLMGRAHAVEAVKPQVTYSYEACRIGPDPRNCTWDGIDNGTVGTLNYWIGPEEGVWPLPHHIAHFLTGWEYPPRTEYMPCGVEDSTNCVWDARHRGNGMGQSYFTGNGGRVWPLPHHIAHYLLGYDRQPV